MRVAKLERQMVDSRDAGLAGQMAETMVLKSAASKAELKDKQ